MSDFYTLDRFDGKKDLNGKIPKLRIICNNRTSGKTTAVSRECIKEAVEKGNEFFIVYRKKYEIANAHHALDSGIALYEKETGLHIETSGKKVDGDIFSIIYFNGEPKGYAIPMKSVDEIKKYSNQFSKVTIGFMDEFQLESEDYVKIKATNMSEIEILQSIITSISRGLDKRARDVVFYLIGNNVSNVNPYYHSLGIFKRLRPETKWMRGDGWILDCERSESAAKDLEENELLAAFGRNTKYMDYNLGRRQLLTNERFIMPKLTGRSRYIATLIYENTSYGVRESLDAGIVHVSESHDPNAKLVYAVTSDDMRHNIALYSRASALFSVLSYAYSNGALYFSDIGARNAAYECLAIKMYA